MAFHGFRKQLNKANQYVNEKIGGAKGTELDDNFLDMEKKTDAMFNMIDDLLAKTHELLQPNPASRAKMSAAKSISKLKGGSSNQLLYPQPEGLLGVCMMKYGKELGDDSLFGQALIEAGETYKQMAEVKYTMEDTVKQDFIEPMQQLQNKDLKEVMQHRKKMNGRRLDYDCKKRKEKDGGPNIEEEIRSAEEKFEESKALAEAAMHNLLENEADQVLQLSAFIEAEILYHKQSAEILQALQESLKKKCAVARSRPSREPKTSSSMSRTSSNKSSEHDFGFSDTSNYGGYSTPSPSRWTPYCEAMYDFVAENDGELSFVKGERVELTSRIDENWLEGTLRGKTGYFPANFVNIIVDLP